jgi:hypothetical protein
VRESDVRNFSVMIDADDFVWLEMNRSGSTDR